MQKLFNTFIWTFRIKNNDKSFILKNCLKRLSCLCTIVIYFHLAMFDKVVAELVCMTVLNRQLSLYMYNAHTMHGSVGNIWCYYLLLRSVTELSFGPRTIHLLVLGWYGHGWDVLTQWVNIAGAKWPWSIKSTVFTNYQLCTLTYLFKLIYRDFPYTCD